MDVLNAIAKVRFNSARPQRVQLYRRREFLCELLCLEPRQELSASGRCAYYLIAGSGEVRSGRNRQSVDLGNFLTFEEGESHTLVNSSEQRLICMAIS